MDKKKTSSFKIQTKPMWTKSLERKSANMTHSSNFNAGHVEIKEYHLSRTGLRGRKRWFMWCGLSFLLLVALGNLAVNCLLLAVLRISPLGLPYMVLWSTRDVIFLQSLSSSAVKVQSPILSYYNKSVHFASSDSIELNVGSVLSSPQILVKSSEVRLKPYELFSIYNKSNIQAFSIDESKAVISKLKPFPNLSTTSLTTSKISSSSISSSNKVNFVANSKLEFQSQSDIKFVSSKNIRTIFRDPSDHLIIESRDGIMLDNLPIELSLAGSNSLFTSYQLCICNNGKLFRVPFSCAQANENVDPCLY